MSIDTITYSIFLVVGLGLTLTITYSLVTIRVRCSFKVLATCLDRGEISWRSGNGTETRYDPILKYTFNNKLIISSYTELSYKKLPDVGKVIPIWINPNNPKEIYVKNYKEDFLFLFIGVLFILITSYFLLFK